MLTESKPASQSQPGSEKAADILRRSGDCREPFWRCISLVKSTRLNMVLRITQDEATDYSP